MASLLIALLFAKSKDGEPSEWPVLEKEYVTMRPAHDSMLRSCSGEMIRKNDLERYTC